MFGEKDLSNELAFDGESSVTNPSRRVLERIQESPDKKTELPEKGIHFLRRSEVGRDGFTSKSMTIGSTGSQELTLSYLCDNSKLGFPQKDFTGKALPEKVSYKGKEVSVSEKSNQDEKWVERDFLNLNEARPKREMEDDVELERGSREKKQKLKTLNLSLGPPDVSLSLTASNALQNADPPAPPPKPSRSVQSLQPSNNNTQTQATSFNDFSAASMSFSHSHPFSHNPSCSLTRNSTENYDYSVGRDDQIWNCGEGTNGSVHSRFKPIGDGVALSNHGGGVLSMMQSNRVGPSGGVHKDSGNNSLYKTASSDNLSFFPSELQARMSGDSRGRGSQNSRGFEVGGSGKSRMLSGPDRILRLIISESIQVAAQIVQELPEEVLESTKEWLRNLISLPEKKEELEALQNQLGQRSDLRKEALSKCHIEQLGILVALKTGLKSFLSGKNRPPVMELVEIFLLLKCRNVMCKSVLPVDDCDCRICSANKGFCSSCMCPVCQKFDCASNTCSWVGCDVCSHWCHAACGIQENLIRPGPSLKGLPGTTEIQFNCIGCGHASEMFGFVKDVFVHCAKDWGLETLIKELDCVKKIFRRSEDYKGKELYIKAEEMLSKLQSKMTSPLDACNFLIQFFNYTDTMSEFPAPAVPPTEMMATQANLKKNSVPPQHVTLPPKYTYNMSSSSIQRDLHDSLSNDLHQKDPKASHMSETSCFAKMLNDDYDSIESIVRIKEAEARMFQNKADEACREAEGYRRVIQVKNEKLEEEYNHKLSKLCVQETEERQRKKMEELKNLENSHRDYYNTKLRMQAEIAVLLERMEATKQQWV